LFHKATSINEVIEQQINIGVDVNDEWLEQGIQDVIKHMTFTKLMTKYKAKGFSRATKCI